MTRSSVIRIVLNLGLLVSLLWLPWFLALLFALLLTLRFRAYEVIAWGAYADALYGAPPAFFADIPLFFTLAFTALLVLAEYGKRFLVFYSSE